MLVNYCEASKTEIVIDNYTVTHLIHQIIRMGSVLIFILTTTSKEILKIGIQATRSHQRTI